MPRITIDGHPFISFDSGPRSTHWPAMSTVIIEKYGNSTFTNHQDVENIFLDAFNYFVNQFETILQAKTEFSFYVNVFLLHEESIKLWMKSLRGENINGLDLNYLPMYRRILKLILEQGCNQELTWGRESNAEELRELDNIVQELIYVGTFIYEFADMIAYHKMIEESHSITFNENDELTYKWQYHYGSIYKHYIENIRKDYQGAVLDAEATTIMRDEVESCFNLTYGVVWAIIDRIKRHHNPTSPATQTIENAVLPINVEMNSDATIELARTFFIGLSISSQNKHSVEEAVRKPHSTLRHLFRPILIYNIEGEERALIGSEKWLESFGVIATNAVQWNTIFDEWKTLDCVEAFINTRSLEHDRILEDEIEKKLVERGLKFCRNLKSLIQTNQNNIRIDTPQCGEIDFIICVEAESKILVSEVKYNKARYDSIGFRHDNSNLQGYEEKIRRKTVWISNHLAELQQHFQAIYNDDTIDFTGYTVESTFLINTPTFYMFNGDITTIPLNRLSAFLEGENLYPDFVIVDENDESEILMTTSHPYFRKPYD